MIKVIRLSTASLEGEALLRDLSHVRPGQTAQIHLTGWIVTATQSRLTDAQACIEIKARLDDGRARSVLDAAKQLENEDLLSGYGGADWSKADRIRKKFKAFKFAK